MQDPDKIERSISYVCLRYLDPRIPNLEIKRRSFKWNGRNITLFIIHIPPSDLRPHSFVWQDLTHFVKRYDDHTREYPMSELAEAFSARHYSPIIGHVNDRLETMWKQG